MPTLKERLRSLFDRHDDSARKEFITKKYMETSRFKYCTRCGEKLIYANRRVSYNSSTGEIAYITHTFACPKHSIGLFGERHDTADFEYRGLDDANT